MKKIHIFLSLQYFIILLCWILIPKSNMMRIYIGEIGLFAIMTVFNARKIIKAFCSANEGRKTMIFFISFFIVSFVYLCLSFRNLADYWHIFNLTYNQSFIPRHFYIIPQFFVGIGLAYSLFRSKFLLRIKNKWIVLAIVVILFLTSLDFSSNSKAYSTLIVLLLSLLGIRYGILLVLLPAVGFLFTGSTTYLLAIIALSFIMLFKKIIARHLYKYGRSKLFVWLMLTILAFLMLSTIVSETIDSDVNATWRVAVWNNEMTSLARTYYTGVGFGTAYVSNDIIYETDNLNMYIYAINGFSEGVMIIANHNSVLNMFYRMGLLGGTLFIIINLFLLYWCLNSNRIASGKMNKYLWWAIANYIFNFTVILFNPGLEMMQFSTGYQLSLAVLLSMLFATSRVQPNTAKIKRL